MSKPIQDGALFKFGDLSLAKCGADISERNPQPKIDTLRDHSGRTIRRLVPRRITRRHRVLASSAAELQSILDPIRAKRGSYNPLYRERGNGRIEFSRAELLDVSETWDQKFPTHRIIETDWLIKDDCWFGDSYNGGLGQQSSPSSDGWSFTDGVVTEIDDTPSTHNLSSSGVANLNLPNAGNYAVWNAVLKLHFSSACTHFAFSKEGECFLQYQGQINQGQSIFIDCGNKTVLKEDEPAYSNVTFAGTLAALATDPGGHIYHQSNDWLTIDAGGSDVKFWLEDGAATLTAYYHDGWV